MARRIYPTISNGTITRGTPVSLSTADANAYIQMGMAQPLDGDEPAGLLETLACNRAITASTTARRDDSKGTISATHATVAIVITIPPDTSVMWPDDAAITATQDGNAAVSFAAGSGVTFDDPGDLPSPALHRTIFAFRKSANRWVLA